MRAWLGFERSSNPPNRPISFRFLLRRKRAVIHHPRPSTKRKEEERERERRRGRCYYNPFSTYFDRTFRISGRLDLIFYRDDIERDIYSIYGLEGREEWWFPFPFFFPLSCPLDHTGGSTVWLSLMSSNGRLFCWTKSWKIL